MDKNDAEGIALKIVVGKELFGEEAAQAELTGALIDLSKKYSIEQCRGFYTIIGQYSDEQFVKNALAAAGKALDEKIKEEAAKRAALLAKGRSEAKSSYEEEAKEGGVESSKQMLPLFQLNLEKFIL